MNIFSSFSRSSLGLFFFGPAGLLMYLFLLLSVLFPGGVSFLLLLLSLPPCSIHHCSLYVSTYYRSLHDNVYYTYSILFDWFICCSSSGSSSWHFIDCPSGSRYYPPLTGLSSEFGCSLSTSRVQLFSFSVKQVINIISMINRTLSFLILVA